MPLTSPYSSAMDDKDKETLSGGGIGAAVGAVVGGGPGAALGGVVGALLGSHEKKHNKALRQTVYNLQEATNGEPKFYVDHIDPNGTAEEGPRNRIKGLSMVPDLVMVAQNYPNLIVEVETVEAVQENQEHIIDQLNDFQTSGFKRVLVVPEADLEDVKQWVEYQENGGNLNSEVILSTPESIAGVL